MKLHDKSDRVRKRIRNRILFADECFIYQTESAYMHSIVLNSVHWISGAKNQFRFECLYACVNVSEWLNAYNLKET